MTSSVLAAFTLHDFSEGLIPRDAVWTTSGGLKINRGCFILFVKLQGYFFNLYVPEKRVFNISDITSFHLYYFDVKQLMYCKR